MHRRGVHARPAALEQADLWQALPKGEPLLLGSAPSSHGQGLSIRARCVMPGHSFPSLCPSPLPTLRLPLLPTPFPLPPYPLPASPPSPPNPPTLPPSKPPTPPSLSKPWHAHLEVGAIAAGHALEGQGRQEGGAGPADVHHVQLRMPLGDDADHRVVLVGDIPAAVSG